MLLWSSEPSSTQTDPSKRDGDSSERGDIHSLKRDGAVDQHKQPVSSEESPSLEQENAEGQPSDQQVSCSSVSAEDDAGSTKTATEDDD